MLQIRTSCTFSLRTSPACLSSLLLSTPWSSGLPSACKTPQHGFFSVSKSPGTRPQVKRTRANSPRNSSSLPAAAAQKVTNPHIKTLTQHQNTLDLAESPRACFAVMLYGADINAQTFQWSQTPP